MFLIMIFKPSGFAVRAQTYLLTFEYDGNNSIAKMLKALLVSGVDIL